ncbi:MAG: serine/threonine protein kinase [Nocardioides sp.]|nr:serine/threonine protein kinase [Nocardioides sp.]
MIAGRYSLGREIGRGGMGAVWLGRDEVLGRAVALKRVGMMPGGSSPDLERAEREAKLAARLNHPHVVAVFDFVKEADHQWLVMEYVDGVTLAELVRNGGPIPPDQAAPLLAQVVDALAAAHAVGIVHRDVKPSNILVTQAGQVKLSDFGIARAEADASLTQTGLVTGSPAYLAPEVASGGTATDASDVWSLGATLYHALAGHPPYEVGDNLLGAMYRIVHEDPPRLANAGWLAPLLDSTMTREPEHRWSMRDVHDFLTAGPAAATSARKARAAAAAGAPADSRQDTRVLSQVVPPVPPTTPPTRVVTPLPPAPMPHRKRRGVLPLTLIGAVVAVVLLIALAYTLGGGGGGGNGGNTGPSAKPAGGSTKTSDANATRATVAGMEDFIGTYLSTVTADPRAAFEMLTPEFQVASGNLSGYEGFWETVKKAKLLSIEADPNALTVHYSVEYNRAGDGKSTDETTLQLTYNHGSYLIADEF